MVNAWKSVQRMAQLEAQNRIASKPVVAPRGPVVSLTSFGRRIGLVHLAIESIAQGSVLPSQIILWLEDESVVARPSAGLSRLMNRGLEIRSCIDWGPHKKYRPYVESEMNHQKPLVTADDDVAYPAGWLRSLVSVSSERPEDVIAHRTRTILTEGRGLAPYATWPDGPAPEGSPRTIAIGVGGVLYPPAFLDELRDTGGAFLDHAPRADDLWLHHRTLQAGRQVTATGAYGHEAMVPLRGTRSGGLIDVNVGHGGNDAQAAATYSAPELDAFVADSAHGPGQARGGR